MKYRTFNTPPQPYPSSPQRKGICETYCAKKEKMKKNKNMQAQHANKKQNPKQMEKQIGTVVSTLILLSVSIKHMLSSS